MLGIDTYSSGGNLMEQARIDDQTIKELIRERDANSPDEFVVIENKKVTSFHDTSCKNIIFKNCLFSPRSEDILFSNSYFENIVLEDCFWYDSKVSNTTFKNITMRRCTIYNNVSIKKCIFDGLEFVDSLLGFFGFAECEIKNTDFRGHEYFFLQVRNLQFVSDLFSSGQMANVREAIEQNTDRLCIAWYNMKYTNCIISLDDIKRLASYSDKIDSNYSWLGYAAFRTGFIDLEKADDITRYSLIANTFLYDAIQEYDYSGDLAYKDYEEYRAQGRKYLPPLFFDKIDLSKYRKTLSTKKKENSMTILDSEGREIDPSLIIPLGEIEFVNSFYKDSDFVESHFDAGKLNEKYSNGNKAYKKSLW